MQTVNEQTLIEMSEAGTINHIALKVSHDGGYGLIATMKGGRKVTLRSKRDSVRIFKSLDTAGRFVYEKLKLGKAELILDPGYD